MGLGLHSSWAEVEADFENKVVRLSLSWVGVQAEVRAGEGFEVGAEVRSGDELGVVAGV